MNTCNQNRSRIVCKLFAVVLLPTWCWLLSSNTMAQTLPIVPLAIIKGAPISSVADTDGKPGENVVLDGSGSFPSNATYTWYNLFGSQVGSGIKPTVRLPDGANQIKLVVTTGIGPLALSSQAVIEIDVASVAGLVASTGATTNRQVASNPSLQGALVTLDGTASQSRQSTIASYQWILEARTTNVNGTTVTTPLNTPLGTGAVLNNVLLQDGVNRIVLTVTDALGNVASDVLIIVVGTVNTVVNLPGTALQALSSLSINQMAVAKTLDNLCPRLAALQQNGQTLTINQTDLLNHCTALLALNPVEQAKAVDQLGASDLNAMRSGALLSATTQLHASLDRLSALRSGAHGVDISGANFTVDGKAVPLNDLLASLSHALGGGGSADEQKDTLPTDKWGVWLRGNYASGSKSISAADNGFDSHQWGATIGVDYRLTRATVVGLSASYDSAATTFNPSGRGDLNAISRTGTGYLSTYLVGNWYLDGVFSYVSSQYDSQRHILYTENGTSVDRVAQGTTRGHAQNAGLATGYEIPFGAVTLTPSVSYLFVNTYINRFMESGASGLDLAYDPQHDKSATATAGLRVTYAWKLPWMVVLPYLNGEYVREFQTDIATFNTHFANDPFVGTLQPTAPTEVQTDVPDNSYQRLSAGISAQFKYNVSAYVDYQRIASLRYMSFENVTIGLRIQHPF